MRSTECSDCPDLARCRHQVRAGYEILCANERGKRGRPPGPGPSLNPAARDAYEDLRESGQLFTIGDLDRLPGHPTRSTLHKWLRQDLDAGTLQVMGKDRVGHSGTRVYQSTTYTNLPSSLAPKESSHG